ncbi:MAG TPA: hypothetical protein VGM22_15515 [Methylomirabilota bacterium]|jgi:hypothetical protein
MDRWNALKTLTNERGVALPMALITLVLLTTLMLAFAVLSQTEPVIAANQLRTSQARALAESGFEYAVWALGNGNTPIGVARPAGTLANPLPSSPAPAPFDGNTFTVFGTTGGFIVTVANDPGGDPDQRQITSIGWTPTNDPTDTHTKAHRKIQANVVSVPNLASRAPCALCVAGELSVGGHAAINGTNTDPKCGGDDKYGTYTSGTTTMDGSATVTGGAGGIAQNQGMSAFNNFTFSNATLDRLKDLARKNGTYFGPGFSGAASSVDGTACPTGATTKPGCASTGAAYDGSVHFTNGNQVANGVVFIDTTDGVNLAPSGTDVSTLADLRVDGNPFSAGDFSGYLIVNGTLTISGNMAINGLVYAVNDFTYNGTGTGAINGLAVSRNIRDTSATSIDSDSGGNSRVNFNCANTAAPQLSGYAFGLVKGTYRELAD